MRYKGLRLSRYALMTARSLYCFCNLLLMINAGFCVLFTWQ
nr:MAG TPA: hypothetical protein [Inoviridae sp.]